MPRFSDYRIEGSNYRTTATIRPRRDDSFNVLTDNDGGSCCECGAEQHGYCWGGSHWVICGPCATSVYNAPRAWDWVDYNAETTAVPAIETLHTKTDKNFMPQKYRAFSHHENLSGGSGCQGYRCSTTDKNRTLKANIQFMRGEYPRGNLCQPCFDKLLAKYNEVSRTECGCCVQQVPVAIMTETLYRARKICTSCRTHFFHNCESTSGGYVFRDNAVYCDINGVRTYATEVWAEENWHFANGSWYHSHEAAAEAQHLADIAARSMDATYRDRHIASDVHNYVFGYGTNIIKMLGFPEQTKIDALCFGVELEMLPKIDRGFSQEHVTSALGGKWAQDRPYILCRDGSLGEQGVEMITLPYTLDAHKSGKFVDWQTILADLRKVAMSGKGTKACGMHVHINKRALSHLQLGKMLTIINAPEMQELIACIAQRTDSGYSHRKLVKFVDGKRVEGAHHDALNVATSKGTAELRIFRGNLRYERVMKNLEFAHALCQYAQDASLRDVHIPERLMTWLFARRAQYPFLVAFLKEQYRPTDAYAALAARIRASGESADWSVAANAVTVTETEGDI